MTDALKQFSVELWSIDAEAARMFDSMIKQINDEAIMNRHARSLLRGCEWIASHTERTLLERVEQMQRLTEFEGPVVLGMRAFTNWH
jgi:hypothetical protein